ncbi:hypothetical protein HYH03_007558 [Edaphochlamys debaryana]|uniref:Uncharacterized protein n=1 Tax=Edaphochlamys debaryana TaxID=47281 RepID=A0A836BZ18_9CHLO|nr:hypothetical protein HYH03_007558 [Edaphochlamys debaryana]|eukprot:KAG2494200.1 hypothetical protein HYH03_007558 [Edaphochlamys debaryana]
MPYCEGIEIAVTEERVAPIPAPRATQGTLSLRDQAPTLDHGQGAPVPPATEGPSDEDNSLAARFRRELRRNADGLRSVVTGERVLPLPFQFRAFESLTQARDTLVSTASVNVEKMGIMAHFLSHRTVDSAKLLWERFSSEEETE